MLEVTFNLAGSSAVTERPTMAKKRFHDGMGNMKKREMYAGAVESKKMRHRDGAMIDDDWSQPCLLPKEVMDKMWAMPAQFPLDGSMPGDLFSGVQAKMRKDASDLRREKDFNNW